VGVVQRAVNGKVKDWKARMRTMGLDVLSSAQLYMRSRQHCNDSFSKKKMPFHFNHQRNPIVESRNKKFGSSKHFEIPSVQEKETKING
jgi:hypothetical protein